MSEINTIAHDLVGAAERWQKRLLRLFHPGDCGGALAYNKDNRILVFGAIPMHLLAEMGDEGTCVAWALYWQDRTYCRYRPTTCP